MWHLSRFISRALPIAAVAFTFATVAVAQTGPDLLIRPWPEGQRFEANGGVTFLNEGSTRNADSFRMTFYESVGRLRLFPEERADPRFGYEVTYIDLDTNDPALPGKLTDESVAFGMGVASQGGWIAGITVGIGYAAAGAFDDGNAYYGKADFAIGKDIDETSQIGFVLDYDGNRTFLPDVPLPGVEYRKRIDPTLLLAVGFPYSSIEWKPLDKLQIDARYVFPDDGDARVTYEVIDTLGVFASYALRKGAFHWDELPNSSDRLMFQQRRVEAGLRWTPVEAASLIVAGGYAFSQEFNVGWDTRDQDRVAKPSDEPYLRAGFELRY